MIESYIEYIKYNQVFNEWKQWSDPNSKPVKNEIKAQIQAHSSSIPAFLCDHRRPEKIKTQPRKFKQGD